jgi:hypothetical protein
LGAGPYHGSIIYTTRWYVKVFLISSEVISMLEMDITRVFNQIGLNSPQLAAIRLAKTFS